MDATLFRAINQLAGHVDAIDDAAELIARFGPFAFVAALAILWFWPGDQSERTRRQHAVILAAMSASLSLGINQLVILVWERPRPFATHAATLLLPGSHDPSFPSDHATFGFAVAVALLFANRRIGTIAIAAAAMLALSRVYVGEHYVSDVVAGAAIGTAVALALAPALPLAEPLIAPPLRFARRLHLA